MILARRLAFLASVLVSGSAQADIAYEVLEFTDLPNWEQAAHDEALEAFRSTCPDMEDPDWHRLCAVSQNPTNAKSFFELFFRPVVISDGSDPLFTGYFEPELNGSLRQSQTFRYPVYSLPQGVKGKEPWYTREEIERDGILEGQGLEIAWVDDPVDLFFAQIQGSARIRLPDGSAIRIGYAGHNGHSYLSIGKKLSDWGVFEKHQVSAKVIREWVRSNPGPGQQLLWTNPSYVFFARIENRGNTDGPIGAMSRPLSEMRSVAVDPDYVPLGAPVWIEKDGRIPIRQLMVAQDTGSAIKGAQRADIFVGTGPEAGEWAGTMRDSGRMAVLFPIQRAFGLALEADE